MSIEPQARAITMRRRAHVARLYPTAAQAVALDRQGHTARAIWNLLHEWYSWGDGQIARRPSRGEIDRQLREGRTNPLPGWEWLGDLPAQATQQVVKHYLRAWDRYYKGGSKRPKFKQRNRHMAVDSPQASDLRIRRLNRRWGEITVQMAGRMRFRWTRPLPGVFPRCRGRITGARLLKDTLGWRVCFRIEEPAEEVAQNTGPPVGVDRGVVHTMALSDGHYLDMPELLRPGERRRLRRLELQAARRREARRKKPGTLMSRRENRVYGQLAALRARQARRREDWLHKQTTHPVRPASDRRA
jgi:putative transposase